MRKMIGLNKDNMAATLVDPVGQNNISLLNGILKYKNMFYIRQSGELRGKLMKELHY